MLNIDNMNRWEVYELMKKEYMATGAIIDVPALIRSQGSPYKEYEEAMEGYEEFKLTIGH